MRTVNLSVLATAFSGQAREESNYNWTVLSKAGNSDTSERTTMIEIFLDLFGAQNIGCLLVNFRQAGTFA